MAHRSSIESDMRLTQRRRRALAATSVVLLCGTGLILAGCASSATDPALDLSTGAGLNTGSSRVSAGPKTWKDLREQNVILQRHDYSCGAAAMATLLTYYFHDEVGEQEILADVVEHLGEGEYAKREENGLSLLDLKQYAERRGYQAVGVKLKLAQLRALRGPVVVYVETGNFEHFVVVRGVRGDRIYLADPTIGNVRKRVSEFAEEWQEGITLAVGKEGFGTPSEHPLAVDHKGAFRNELRTVRRVINPAP